MRINTIGTPLVTVPEASPEVGAPRALTSVQGRAPGSQGAQQLPVPRAQAAAPAALLPVTAQAERRGQVRRGEERRRRQVSVLIDTRVGQRRAQRRRAQDEAPPSVDVEA